MVGYLGPVGTFSYMAAKQYTEGKNVEISAYPSIYKLIESVDNGEIESCVVPIENSIEGSVNSTLDSIAVKQGLYIVGEITLKISENLMVKPGMKAEDVKRIISHPQPIGQSMAMINEKFPDAEIEYTNSTAEAAKIISESDSNDTAMIGPKACAEIYGLEILIEDCQEEKNNKTRFVALRKTPCEEVSDNDKTSLIFTTDNRPGCLFNVLKTFSENNVNMIKIESRPEKKEMGRYIFFVDTDGNIKNESVLKSWEEIKKLTYWHKFLGSYKKG